LEDGLHALPALVAGGRLGKPFQRVETGSRLRIRAGGRDHLEGSRRRHLSKGGSEALAIGRSRGGLTTKIHAAVDALGLPIRFIITPGHWGDCPQACGLIEGLTGVGHVIADAAYDADHLRAFIRTELKAEAQIKQNPTRTVQHPMDWSLYKERHLVECFFNRIKRFRRIALRCEKTVASFKAFVDLACAMAWLA
jgi:putative transposase